MRIVRRETYARMPWKNGQGLTEEVVAFPLGSGVDGFDWRLSIAHVKADGPFSLFPGIDRTISLLEGEGMVLALPGGRETMLTRGGAPFAFPGEWPIASRNLGGATVDLNIMTRRGRFTHAMRRLRFDAESIVVANRVTLLVIEAACGLQDPSGPFEVRALDTVSLQPGEEIALVSAGGLSAHVIEIHPAG